MSVSIEDIKKLRESTGVSMMACKSALEESNGDYEEAVDLLRKKGESKAAKKADRSAGEGAVAMKIEGGKGAIAWLNCETDFMARGDDFLGLLDKVLTSLFSGEIAEESTELDFVKEAVLKLGENIQVGGLKVLEGDNVGGYIHSNKKIGVLVALKGGNEELARDISMHAAATNPAVISPDEVSEELVAREKAIWSEQLAAEGKPAEILEKIMMGKEKKFREDSALLKQAFVKDPDKTIEELLKGADAEIQGFVRFGS